MIEDGFLEEVQSLMASTELGTQAREALGYRELAAVIAGETSLQDAMEAIKIRTRRYAKQQRTWLRRFQAIPETLWLDAQDRSSAFLAEKIARWVCPRDA